MKHRRIDVGQIRRGQIVEAAVGIIAEQGLQNLSLSEIETRAGMSRGQLTYYFRTKEDILLAVFDRLLQLMHERAAGHNGNGTCALPGGGWERVRHLLTFLLLTPPAAPEFHSLQYTFLSQIGHRDDFRRRLASLYGDWRRRLATDFAEELARAGAGRRASPRTLATFVQALLHGLAMQRAADPDAYDRQEMLDLCLDVLGTYLRPAAEAPRKRKARTAPAANGKKRPAARPPRVIHE